MRYEEEFDKNEKDFEELHENGDLYDDRLFPKIYCPVKNCGVVITSHDNNFMCKKCLERHDEQVTGDKNG